MEITLNMALYFAELNGLTYEVESYINKGYTPKEALKEWDCMPTNMEILDYLFCEGDNWGNHLDSII